MALKIVGGIIIGGAFVFLYIYAFMSLWNWIVPEVFTGPKITFLHALGLMLLAKMLFGGFHNKSGGCGSWKSRKKAEWKQRFKQKWQGMTDEEKAELKSKFKSKFGKCWTDDMKDKAPIVLLALCMI